MADNAFAIPAVADIAPYGSDNLFARLRAASGDDWQGFCRHAFVLGLGDGSLPGAAFRHYLVQDYLFLIQFARAYGLAAYKSDSLHDLLAASHLLSAIVDKEINLHLDYCDGWGLSQADLAQVAEDLATTAYTRYVLDRGLTGDLLDLFVALAPCVVGYGEIGRRLAEDDNTRWYGNPYREWIEMYAGEDYQRVAVNAVAELDRLFHERGGAGRFNALAASFGQATRLEIAFWDMGWRAGR